MKDPMDKFVEILGSCGADGWEIRDTRTRGWEFYFIGHRLDQNRARDVEHINISVYKKTRDDDGEYMGVASAEVSPTETEEEIRRIAEGLVYKASLVKNAMFTLNPPREIEPLTGDVTPLEEDAEAFLRAMAAIEETDTEDLNSYEIFVERNSGRLITSEGINVSFDHPSAVLDIVVNARKDDHEIELYRLYELGTCDQAQLKTDVEELLAFGRDRLLAVPTPNLAESPVVLSTDAALQVYEYFTDNLNASYLVRGMSDYSIGKPIAEEITGDRITIRSVRELPGSPKNFACDSEGAPVRDAVLMKDGVPERFVGSRMFSQYMGLEDSFSLTNYSVSGGSRTAESIREGNFLEVVEFSDFQVDSVTGDIFGEIRLAYWHDGSGKVTPVSGGSISGSMADNIGCMYMTKETRRYAGAEIPAATRLEKITVAGAES